jgi:integrase
MARLMRRLSAIQVARAKTKGMLADGGGLYLQVGETGNKSWIFRFAAEGKTHDMGLGSLHTIGLAEAREIANEQRQLRLKKIDPIKHRKAQRASQRLADAKTMTFDQCRDAFLASHQVSWRNKKHRQQWSATLKTYVTPVFGLEPVQAVDVSLVMKAIEPIWAEIPETASRVRQRIERILDWAKVRGVREGENPARWRGHLDHLLPSRSRVRKPQKHSALPYGEIGAFMQHLRGRQGTAARALEFLILTAVRTGEVLGARWPEIDVVQHTWTIPAERMKAGKEHRVPLSNAAMAVLRTMQAGDREYVFPGSRKDRPLSNMAMLVLLRRMERSDITVHGFRSTFRDWAAELTNFPREVAEMALAHTIGSKVEAAYRRGDLFEKRRRLMQAWAGYCAPINSSNRVIALQTRAPV